MSHDPSGNLTGWDLSGFHEGHDTEAWREALRRNGWIDAFETGDNFGTFLTDQDERVESTLKELGLS